MLTERTLSERAQQLLRVLIERYIRDGQPVGSKTLVEDSALMLSPATVRNIMADLEDRGYVHSPHTSAGRIPTVQGYRFFIDSLLTFQPLGESAIQQVQQQLHPDMNAQELVASTSSLLSGICRLAGLVTIPRRERLLLRHVEFLSLSEHRVLVILVVNEHEVQNRIIYTEHKYEAHELQQAANYLNELFSGKDLMAVRKELLEALHCDKATMNRLMQTAIDVADKAFEHPVPKKDYVLAGQSYLLDMADITGVEKMRNLFEAFNEKRKLLHLLDQSLQADGVQIYIGKEAGLELFNDCSLVMAPYTAANQVAGVLGVIGPTRMAYEKVIPMVDITAKILSAALNQPK